MAQIPDAGPNITSVTVNERIRNLSRAVMGIIVFASVGGIYIWSEISLSRIALAQSVNNVPAPAVAPRLSVPAAPSKLFNTDKAAAPRHSGRKKPASGLKSVSTPAIHQPQDEITETSSAVAPASPIRIERSQEKNEVDPLLLLAWQSYQSGDYDIAMQHYNEVLSNNSFKHNSPNRDALLGLAAIAQQRSQDALAAHYYDQLLSLDPRDPEANAGKSSLLGEAVATDTESRLKLLLAQHSTASALYFALGNLYANQSRWSDAETAYFSAYKAESGNARNAFNLAVSLDHLGQVKLAAQYYQHALELELANNISALSGKLSIVSFDHAQTKLRLDELTR